MPVVVKRAGSAVSAVVVEDEKTYRIETCRNVQCAVMLEMKLAADPRFAERWVRDKDNVLPVSIPHGCERRASIG